jgi:hypothetical protein
MGRVKVKVKHIHIQEKAKLKEKKIRRRKKRVEKEGGEGPSKYPEGYIDDPLDSIRSNYDPIVGEVNYMKAVLPKPPVILPPSPPPK